MSARPRAKRVGEALLSAGEIDAQSLERALADQRRTGRLLGEMLVDQGTVSRTALVRALAESTGIPGVNLRHGLVDPDVFKLVGEEEAERLKALPLFLVRDELTVALADPTSLPTIDRLKNLTGLKIRPVLALETNIYDFIAKYRAGDVDVNEFLASLGESNVDIVENEAVDEGPSSELDLHSGGSPVVNLVNVALLTAVKDGASDLHVEPNKHGTRIRYRVDGMLRELMNPPPGMHAAIVSRIKVIGQMDIAERRLPQEGRVRIAAEGRDIDLRVSSMPTLLGEKLVIRVLDKKNLRVRLEDLGFTPSDRDTFTRVLNQPHGLLLVTGPTGSGKTTTLYSAMDLLRSPEKNLVTVEDPVEYQLDMINQIQIRDAIGFGFARALRSILRQDPDVIMVGEVRDQDTARVAVQAALTGHLVLATLHTNDAPGAVARLLDMGIEPYLLASALNGAVAQRLCRTNCAGCETRYHPSEQALKDAQLTPNVRSLFRRGGGCSQCGASGFLGRVGVYEMMEITPALRQLVYDAAPTDQLRAELRRTGSKSLRTQAIGLAVHGRTSLEEALRVTRTDDALEPGNNRAPSAQPTGTAPGNSSDSAEPTTTEPTPTDPTTKRNAA
ncbi:MAG: ATPase, T2SS/T4P/T4SS family [Planctomycetota bacterium]